MVDVGDDAPDFTAPLANGEVDEFTLTERLDEAPLVFAFFPAAYTSTCTDEMAVFEERLGEFEEYGATVYGVSVDMPFALDAFRSELGLSYGLISDTNRRLVDAYDVERDFVSAGVDDVANRAVFVVDGDGVVRYAWRASDFGLEPDYDDVLEAVAELA